MTRLLKLLMSLFGFAFFIGTLPEVQAIQPKKHGRGHVPAPPDVRQRLHAGAIARHGDRVKNLPKATQAAFDCRTAFNNVLPTDDQGQCGDCFGVSTADGASMALIKAGVLPNDTVLGRLSSQYGLDSGAFQGGCRGGDEAQVAQYLMSTGFPLTSQYGPYSGGPGRPKDTSGMTFYKLADFGYCTPSQQEGVAATQDIKNCMAQYGPISVAFDASECDNYTWPQTMTGTFQNVDHAVLCIGWDDNHVNGDGSIGAFIGMNQWGQASSTTVTFQSTPWGGPNGTFWIKYGADSWGTEAIWMTGAPLPPPGPTPPTPTPPTPVPPTPVPPTPVPCTPTFHLLGRPHWRCDTTTTTRTYTKSATQFRGSQPLSFPALGGCANGVCK